jgi:signal transduction histidine kinase
LPQKVDVKVKKIIEDERQRLARELHDSVSQQLFAASMMLSAIKETKSFKPSGLKCNSKARISNCES